MGVTGNGLRDRPRLAAWLMLLGVGVWLWPIGLGGRMPVGGDVTSFSLSLMAFLRESLRAGRLPVWNDLWGYGFPALAESQMGVYYPPHWILYGLLPVEAAYTASLVLHTAWAALGAFWAARRFGTSPAGAALAGFAWSACGFFMIHLPHQWGYTVGSWMPWAWGLTWRLLREGGSARGALGLAAVLTVQVLPGHFQLAFCTQVGVLLMAAWTLGEQVKVRRVDARRLLLVLGGWAAAVPLAAAQLWPTLRLARLAASQRDYDYLSQFASTPWHLVSFVAPRLFQSSSLWRPLVWDPFRTSPEEHLAYVGLVPLFLALGAIVWEWKRDAATRVLAVLAVVTLVLSLGPYVPGFAYYCRLPGFSFFRGASRWGLTTSLALALLAGRGYDMIGSWSRPGRVMAVFVAWSVGAIVLVLGTIELAVRATDKGGWPAVERGFNLALKALPWADSPDLGALGKAARSAHPDLVLSYAREEARRGRTVDLFAPGPRFVAERGGLYVRELAATGVLLAGLLVVAARAQRPRFRTAALAALTALDLWGLGRHRVVDLAPIRPLSVQSPVLARLAREPRGTRVAEPGHNLAMIAGVDPLRAYRTLDLAAAPALTNLASAPLPPSRTLDALKTCGAAWRVYDALEVRSAFRDAPRDVVRDPALASWLFGTDLVARQGDWLSRFAWMPIPGASRAWRVPLTAGRGMAMLESATDEPAAVVGRLAGATPLPWRSPSPGRVEIDVEVETSGAEAVIVSQLADPQWRARWIADGREREAAIAPVFRRPGQGGWQAVRCPEPGRWTLRLEYDARDVRQGLVVSGAAWLGFAVAWLLAGRRGAVIINEGDSQ